MEKGDSGTVRVEARDRLPASGIIWPEYDLVVTAHHVVERDENYLAALSVDARDLDAIPGTVSRPPTGTVGHRNRTSLGSPRSRYQQRSHRLGF